MKKNNKKIEYGFTLIELIVVIAIIAVLAAIITPLATRMIDRTKATKTLADFKAIKTALHAYWIDVGRFPDPFWLCITNPKEGVWCRGHKDGIYGCEPGGPFDYHPLMANEQNVSGWDGPYLQGEPRSPLKIIQITGGDLWNTGRYWIGGHFCYGDKFDLNDDGAVDVIQAANVRLGALMLKQAMDLDRVVDGNAQVGKHGMLNIYNNWGDGYYHPSYYVSGSAP